MHGTMNIKFTGKTLNSVFTPTQLILLSHALFSAHCRIRDVMSKVKCAVSVRGFPQVSDIFYRSLLQPQQNV